MTTIPRSRWRTVAGVLLAVAGLMAASCSSSSGEAADPAPSSTVASTTTTTLPPRFPLTGLIASGTSPEVLARPALSVKIENSPASRPQSGLDLADVVYEEVVEGGQTRFIAVFHSTDAEVLGPIRSVRPTDPDVVAPLGGLFAYSGGTAPFVAKLRQTPGLVDVGASASADAYRRRPDKRAPHNLYSSSSALYGAGPGELAAPTPLWEFAPDGAEFAADGASELISLDIRVGSSTRATYTWDAASGSWRRDTDGRPHLAESGAQLAPTNVIVQFVPYRDSGARDTAGAVVVEADVIGEGDALVLAGGRFARVRWSKPAAGAPTTFTDVAGQPVRLVPGRTWVELVDPSAPFTLNEPAPPETAPPAAPTSTP